MYTRNWVRFPVFHNCVHACARLHAIVGAWYHKHDESFGLESIERWSWSITRITGRQLLTLHRPLCPFRIASTNSMSSPPPCQPLLACSCSDGSMGAPSWSMSWPQSSLEVMVASSPMNLYVLVMGPATHRTLKYKSAAVPG